MTTNRPAFLTKQNAPPEIAARWDEDWHSLGNVPTARRSIMCMCKRCDAEWWPPQRGLHRRQPCDSVDLHSHRFISGTAEIVIYFGACTKCNEVHFATSLWGKA